MENVETEPLVALEQFGTKIPAELAHRFRIRVATRRTNIQRAMTEAMDVWSEPREGDLDFEEVA